MEEQEQQTLDFVGMEQNGVYRPEITFGNLNTTKVDKSNIDEDGYCDFLRIPLIFKENESLTYQQMFCYLVDKVVSGFNDVHPQPMNLFLVVDDSEGERQYYIGADIQIKGWNGINTRVSTEEIHLTIQEQAIIELSLLKVINPEQYLLKYTRYQIAQRPEVMNKFGYFGDCISNDGSYRSTWIHEECTNGEKQYTYLNICIENVKNQCSKIQILPIGVSQKIIA